MAKNTHMLNIVLEFWRPKCTNKYVYEQFIAIKIVQTLNDTLLQVVLWLITYRYSNKTTRFPFTFTPHIAVRVPVLNGSKTPHFLQISVRA